MEEAKTKQLLELIEHWTRAEIMARHAPLIGLDFTNYVEAQIKKENEIRRLVFGVDNLIELGLKWGLLKDKKTQSKEAALQQFHQIQKELVEMMRE